MNSDQRVSELVEDNVKLAQFMATKASDIDADEAFSLALEALHAAAIKFDSKKGIPFGAFAGQEIRWKLSGHRVYRDRAKRGGRFGTVSLNDLIGEDSEIERGDLVADENADTFAPLAAFDDAQKVKSLLRRLDRRAKLVVSARFGLNGDEPQTLEQVGITLGVTRERVRQIERDSLQKLLPFIQSSPKEIENRYQREYRKRNPVRFKIYNIRRYAKNRTFLLAMKRKEYLGNRDYYRKQARIRYLRNREKICAAVKKYVRANRAKVLSTKRLYREANRAVLADKQLARYHNYYIYCEKYKEGRAAYRAKNRLTARAWSRNRSKILTDGYVREILSKNTGKSAKDWTTAEVQAKRAELLERRKNRVSDAEVLEIRNTFFDGH